MLNDGATFIDVGAYSTNLALILSLKKKKLKNRSCNSINFKASSDVILSIDTFRVLLQK
jgi:dihydropteroate synthase